MIPHMASDDAAAEAARVAAGDAGLRRGTRLA
jgi:hypothetical protein